MKLHKEMTGTVAVSLFYGAFALSLLKFYLYRVHFDAVFYFAIARLYLNGNFSNAVSGYWSPLFSWLMMPGLYLRIPPLLAVRLLQIGLGLCMLFGIRLLLSRVTASVALRTTALFAAVPAIAFFAVFWITPDLLLSCLLTFYLVVISSSDYAECRYKGLLCGVLGGLAYLSKSYAIFFFPLHFIFTHTMYYVQCADAQRRKKVIRNCMLGIGTFCLISGIWIGVISKKNNAFTISKAAEFSVSNEYLDKIATSTSAFSAPMLLELVSRKENGYLDYFDFYINRKQGKANVFFASLLLKIKLIPREVYRFFVYLLQFSVFSAAILLGSILYFVSLPEQSHKRAASGTFFLALVVYSSGYIVLSAEQRYLWFNTVLLLLLGSFVLDELFQNSFFSTLEKRIVLSCFLMSFVLIPLKDAGLSRNANIKEYEISQKLKHQYGIKGRLCSQSPITYFTSLYLESAFYIVRSYNAFDQTPDTAVLEESLKKYTIDYYLVWTKEEAEYPFLRRYKEILKGAIPDLKIYSLKEPVG